MWGKKKDKLNPSVSLEEPEEDFEEDSEEKDEFSQLPDYPEPDNPMRRSLSQQSQAQASSQMVNPTENLRVSRPQQMQVQQMPEMTRQKPLLDEVVENHESILKDHREAIDWCVKSIQQTHEGLKMMELRLNTLESAMFRLRNI